MEKGIDRRTLLALMPAGLLTSVINVAAQCSAPHPLNARTGSQPYTFQFFTESERLLLDRAMDAFIPSDDHSPGADEARVVEFADLMIATSSESVKSDWRDGLRLLAAELESITLDQWMDNAAEHEDNPLTVLDEFYTKVKVMTINGYYTSSIGIHQDLRYQGNTYLTAFPGCEHPEHKS